MQMIALLKQLAIQIDYYYNILCKYLWKTNSIIVDLRWNNTIMEVYYGNRK